MMTYLSYQQKILALGLVTILLFMIASVISRTYFAGPVYTPSPLAQKYVDLTVIDVHNHDAQGYSYQNSLELWEAYDIDKVVLFAGKITDPEAVEADKIAWEASQKYPELIFPFFTGFDVNNEDSLEYTQARFEEGFLGIGEYVGASYVSASAVYQAGWKPKHPMDGYFPEIYDLCAQYQAPILLHIDPTTPHFIAVQKLEEALAAHPTTTFIFAHANAFNTPENLEPMLKKYPNLYLDFFPGFNVYNQQANLPLDAWVPLIEQYPTQFLVGSDSGYGIQYDQAYEAIYILLDKLSESTRENVAHKNFESIIANRYKKPPFSLEDQ